MAKLGTLGMLVFGITPLLGGAVVGSLTHSLLIIGAVGLALWTAQTLALVAYARFSASKEKLPWLRWISTIFTFGASYTAVAVFVSFELHRR